MLGRVITATHFIPLVKGQFPEELTRSLHQEPQGGITVLGVLETQHGVAGVQDQIKRSTQGKRKEGAARQLPVSPHLGDLVPLGAGGRGKFT